MKIKPDQLGAVVKDIMLEYEGKVDDAVREAAVDMAKEGKKTLRKTSPKASGHYRKGWSYGKGKGDAFIYNKTDWQLTHLLEYGHALRQGGRSPAIKHIGPVHDELEAKFPGVVKQRLEDIK